MVMAHSRELTTFLRTGRIRHGNDFDPSAILRAEAFLPYFGTGQRVRVTTVYGEGEDAETFTRTGLVSATTGHRPALLLVHRSNAHGSWDLLSHTDRLVAVQRGRRYVEVPS